MSFWCVSVRFSYFVFEDAVLLTDNQPILEHIYLEAALQWRKDYNEVNAKLLMKN